MTTETAHRISIVTQSMTESVWAACIDEAQHLFTVENVPFFATEVHFKDVVRCKPEINALPLAVHVVKPSGYRTLQIHASALHRRDFYQHPIHQAIHDAGWGGEGGFMGCVVAIPPNADVSLIDTWKQLYPELQFKLV